MIAKIISGGQTGADRAALDFAIRHKIPHGGWIPKGRRTEAGPLPAHYQLREMPSGEYPARTEKNVLDSDGTLIISRGRLTGGSALTQSLAGKYRKPCLHISLDQGGLSEAARQIRAWLQESNIRTLNVAGPRASEDDRIYEATLELLVETFSFVQ